MSTSDDYLLLSKLAYEVANRFLSFKALFCWLRSLNSAIYNQIIDNQCQDSEPLDENINLKW